jgi:hypothetical protein
MEGLPVQACPAFLDAVHAVGPLERQYSRQTVRIPKGRTGKPQDSANNPLFGLVTPKVAHPLLIRKALAEKPPVEAIQTPYQVGRFT